MLVDLSDLDEETLDGVIKEFKMGWEQKKVQARVEQKQLGALNSKDHRGINGLGQLKAQITPESYHYWGQRLGYSCWSDKNFVDGYLRDNPQARTKGGATRIQVGYSSTAPKYRKVYA